MVKTILGVLSLLVMSSCSTVVKENTAQPDIIRLFFSLVDDIRYVELELRL